MGGTGKSQVIKSLIHLFEQSKETHRFVALAPMGISAALYGKLDKEIYMEQPEGFKVKGQENKVIHFNHTIYRLKQAALAWCYAIRL